MSSSGRSRSDSVGVGRARASTTDTRERARASTKGSVICPGRAGLGRRRDLGRGRQFFRAAAGSTGATTRGLDRRDRGGLDRRDRGGLDDATATTGSTTSATCRAARSEGGRDERRIRGQEIRRREGGFADLDDGRGGHALVRRGCGRGAAEEPRAGCRARRARRGRSPRDAARSAAASSCPLRVRRSRRGSRSGCRCGGAIIARTGSPECSAHSRSASSFVGSSIAT